MRFRKARSFLSAFSNGELSEKKQEEVREHLARSESLRREEALYRSMKKACRELPQHEVSDDFNAKLLNRVAQERFAETRTRAYIPKPAPLFVWSKVIPVAVTAVLVVFVSFSVLMPSQQQTGTFMADAGTSLDDSYLTAQPDHNPNMIRGFGPQVSLQGLMAKVDRADEISNFLTGSRDFGGVNQPGAALWSTSGAHAQTPYNNSFFRVRQVIRVTAPASNKEENGVY